LHRDDSVSAILEGLNEIQARGVAHGEGPLLILAGAGSGKTRVLTSRLAHLVAARGVAPDAVLAVTFTNKAAGEMRVRVQKLLGPTAQAIWIGTFHSICLRILRRHQEALGFRGNLTVFDADDSLSLIRQILKESGKTDDPVRAADARSAISLAKNRMIDPERLESESAGPGGRRIARLWRLYDARLREQDGVDFDDLLLLAVRLLRENRSIGDAYAQRFRHILVDEYQDTNRVQLELVRRLAERHGNICAVGDDDQSIYRWRGADVTNILGFERHFPGTAVLRMEQNYRSTRRILDVANAAVLKNAGRMPKTLWTENEPGEAVRLFLAEDEEQEARHVARRIREEVRGGASLSHLAVLYRTHAQSRAIEEACIRAEIPYRVLGGIAFYQRKEVKDLLAYLRLLANPHDEVSFRRAALAPRRGAGEMTIDRILSEARARGVDLLTACERAREWGMEGRGFAALADLAAYLMTLVPRIDEKPHVLLEEIAHQIGYREYLRSQSEAEWEDRFAHVLELIEGARGYEDAEESAGVVDFLEQVALYAQSDKLRDDEERVTLMTVHNAKGLEFDAVLVTGLEDGLFPHISSLTDPEELEEERRLFYVAVTRARRTLTLTASRSRRRINRMAGSDLSRFLSEIPEELLEIEGRLHAATARFPARRAATAKELHEEAAQDSEDEWDGPIIAREPAAARVAGRTLVRHVRYGIGEVLSVDGEGEKARLEVRFPGWGTKKIVRSYLVPVGRG